MPERTVEMPVGASTLRLRTGKLAKQATGAVEVWYGETCVLAAATQGPPIPGRDFFPLTVEYREKVYAAGKFPGGYIKREGRPSLKETLTSRLVDRPIRPLFPTDYFNELQIFCTVLSADKSNDPDVLAMIGSSAALHVTDMPFNGPTGSVRVARVGGQLVAMPSYAQTEESDLDLIVSGTRDAITMIEGFARELPEAQVAEAVAYAHSVVVQIIDLIEKLRSECGLPAKEPRPAPGTTPLYDLVRDRYYNDFRETKLTPGKGERADRVRELKARIKSELFPEGHESELKPETLGAALSALEERVVRDLIMDGKRIDGRSPRELRGVQCDVGYLPRTHGSAVFQRGETQALVVATLGTVGDEQRVEGLVDEFSKKFMLDYNMPPFAVGECRPLRGPGRREIGHGALAERSLKAVIPGPAKFPYTIRLVSEILESNGSSSMASVCGGTLALMDAGVPITNPVAGISIGLVQEEKGYVLLTDIMGDEDHYGDMDFKVAGTQRGITGIQLDMKIQGISQEIVQATLVQAREARIEIMKVMLRSLRSPRSDISELAPRILTVKINPSKIGLLIGPGGKTIKGIQELTGAKIDIEDDGTVHIAHIEAAGAEAAKMQIEALTEEVKVGKEYEGRVSSIKEFGAFVEIAPGRDGLCHISELDDKYVGRVDEVVKVGDRIRVKVISIDEQDRVKLSRKALLRDQRGPDGGQGAPPAAPQGMVSRGDGGPPRRSPAGGRAE